MSLQKQTPKNNKSEWMNKLTLSKFKMKNRSYHRLLKTKDLHDGQMYTKYRNQSKNSCRKPVTGYEKSLSGEVKSNPKAFFRYAKNKLNFKNAIPYLVDNGKILSDDNSKAKTFNVFFKSDFTEKPVCLPDFNLNVKSSIEHVSFPADKIEKKLDNLNPFKSPGTDELHPRVLKELSNELSLHLSLIFSKSFSEGELSHDWKDAIITPFHCIKKGEKEFSSNYGPISLNSFVCKFVESIIKDDILTDMASNKLLTNLQHEFVPGKSCHSNLLLLLNFLTESIENGTDAYLVYLDFAKAFDSLPHNRFICKSNYGIMVLAIIYYSGL